jgi:hypothetical protein
MVDFAVESADRVTPESLGLPSQGAQRGIDVVVREEGSRVFHRRLGEWKRHGGLGVA